MTFDEARAMFPVLRRLAYLNAGSVGPLSLPVGQALETWQRQGLEHGRGGLAARDDTLALRVEARGRIAALLGVDPANVALTYSTTDACQIVLGGLRLRPHDEIVTTDHEHFGLLGALHASGARVVIASPTREAILAAVGRHTRLLALSHVLWTTGNRLPLEELKVETGLPVLVDGAQSVGAIEVDARPFDFYTVSGHKFLCGPDTTGALYVRDPQALFVARPSYFAQETYSPTGEFTPKEGAARFDSGWISPGSLAGLVAALDSAPAWRFDRTLQTADRCRQFLSGRYEVPTLPGQSGLVSLRPSGDPADVVARLDERGVVVREIPGTGLVRASCGYWTSDGDLDRLVDALDEM